MSAKIKTRRNGAPSAANTNLHASAGGPPQPARAAATPGYAAPDQRPLQVFAFDPSIGRLLGNHMTLQLPYETLEAGPVGAESRIAVIDFDASNQCYYAPVDLDDPGVLIHGGLTPSESDPRFHQQMVYAVVRETQRRFEFALGRPMKWRRDNGRANEKLHGYLRVFPHAFQQANAYYDPAEIALFFGYFPSSGETVDTLPGQTIFTCLSYDIVAHETTHALVDSLRMHFTEATSPDTLAFHEAFADIVALFQHFSNREALIETIRRTGGLIHRTVIEAEVKSDGPPMIGAELDENNPLVGLAKQFGEAIGMRKALRSALGTPPDPKQLESEFEPHLRGSILVAAVFDAFFSIYIKRTRDLLRLARASGRTTNTGDLHPDLAERLAREAVKTAQHFLNICIRSLDYCPPVDIQFGEFLRALITADADLVPSDPWGYRADIIRAFRLRGIRPEGVASYSEEALRWRPPSLHKGAIAAIQGLVYDVFPDRHVSKQLRQARSEHTAKLLTNYAKANCRQLGLDATQTVKAHSFHPIWRVRPDGRLAVDYVVEYLQKRPEKFDSDDANGFEFRGGTTVIFDHSGEVRYAIEKSVASASRLERRRAFDRAVGERDARRTFRPDERQPMNFALIHRGC
jgi:hypothetical protein